MRKYLVMITAIIILVTVLLACYIPSVCNTIYKMIYFSENSAMNAWNITSERVYEYKTDDFFIIFCENGNIYTVKKDGMFWVRDDIGGYELSTNDIHSVTVNNIMYVFGGTRKHDVSGIKVIMDLCYEVESVFNSKPYNNTLLFCLEVPIDNFIAIASLEYVDENGNIISQLDFDKEDEKIMLAKNIADTLENAKFGLIDGDVEYADITVVTDKKFYINKSGSDCTFEEHTELFEFDFRENFVLVNKCCKIEKYYSNYNSSETYKKYYKLDYSDDLLRLKEIGVTET